MHAECRRTRLILICDIYVRPSPWRLHLHRGSVGVGRAGSWQIAAVDGEAPKSSEVAQPAVADDDGDGDGRHGVFCVRSRYLVLYLLRFVFNRIDFHTIGSICIGSVRFVFNRFDLYSIGSINSKCSSRECSLTSNHGSCTVRYPCPILLRLHYALRSNLLLHEMGIGRLVLLHLRELHPQ